MVHKLIIQQKKTENIILMKILHLTNYDVIFAFGKGQQHTSRFLLDSYLI